MVVMALVTTFMTTPLISFVYPPKYFTKARVQANTGKLSDSLQATMANTLKMSVSQLMPVASKEPMRMLICVDDLEPLLLIAKLLHLFKPEKTKNDDLTISALKVIEPTERTSSFIVASQVSETVKNDPALNMITLIGGLIGIQTSTFVSMASVEDVGEEVKHISSRERCSLLMLPWNDRIVPGTILSSSPQEMLRNIVNSAEIPTAIFVPKPANSTFPPAQMLRQILVVFFGGSDDREAVRIGLRLFRHGQGIQVTILQICANSRSYSATTTNVYVNQPENPVDAYCPGQNDATLDANKESSKTDSEVIESIKRYVDSQPHHGLNFKSINSDLPLADAYKECLRRRFDLLILGKKPRIQQLNRSLSLRHKNLSANGIAIILDQEQARKRSQTKGGSFRHKISQSISPINLSINHSMSELNANDIADSSALNQGRAGTVTWKSSILADILGPLGEIIYNSNLQTTMLIVCRNEHR